MNLSERLKEEAVRLGLCRQWQSEWDADTDRNGLLRKYLGGIDFCIRHDWPDKDFILTHFGDLLHGNNIFVDDDIELSKRDGMVVLLGRCTGRIKADGYMVQDIYILHDSDIDIVAEDASKVFVNKSKDAVCRYDCGNHAEINEYIIHTGCDGLK